jgi:hypothetical protein
MINDVLGKQITKKGLRQGGRFFHVLFDIVAHVLVVLLQRAQEINLLRVWLLILWMMG